MELMNIGLEAIQHVAHAGDIVTAQLHHALDAVQAALPNDPPEKGSCELSGC